MISSVERVCKINVLIFVINGYWLIWIVDSFIIVINFLWLWELKMIYVNVIVKNIMLWYFFYFLMDNGDLILLLVSKNIKFFFFIFNFVLFVRKKYLDKGWREWCR